MSLASHFLLPYVDEMRVVTGCITVETVSRVRFLLPHADKRNVVTGEAALLRELLRCFLL